MPRKITGPVCVNCTHFYDGSDHHGEPDVLEIGDFCFKCVDLSQRLKHDCDLYENSQEG